MTDETRGVALASARSGCTVCHGMGRHTGWKELVLCGCVLRSSFREVLRRYRYLQAVGLGLYRVTGFELTKRGGLSHGNKDAEFCADVILMARRNLDDFHFQVFRLHFVAELDWKACLGPLARWVRIARATGLDSFPHVDRGNFFHSVYRVENVLGAAFIETVPHGLYPTRRYFQHHHVRLDQIARSGMMRFGHTMAAGGSG